METAKENQKLNSNQEKLQKIADVAIADIRKIEIPLDKISDRGEGWAEDLEFAKRKLRSIHFTCKSYLSWVRDIELADKRSKKKQG